MCVEGRTTSGGGNPTMLHVKGDPWIRLDVVDKEEMMVDGTLYPQISTSLMPMSIISKKCHSFQGD